MIELHSYPTPNGLKISIFLNETGLEHKVFPVNILKGEQFQSEFLAISPNNRIPAIRDMAPRDSGNPITVFESGAILVYLADKVGRFLPRELRARNEVMQWLFWQVGGLGPMAGQNHHFGLHAPEMIDYAIKRYVDETARLYGVLERCLEGRDYVAGDYSIADMAIFPWVMPHESQQQNIEKFPNVERWMSVLKQRPAVIAAYTSRLELYAKAEDLERMSDEQKTKLRSVAA